MRNRLCIILLLLFTFAFAQRQQIRGRVYSGNLGVKDVLVVNQNAQVETRTDSVGSFKIQAQIGDLLIISDYKVESKKIRYTPDLVVNGVVLLEVKMAAIELEEVVIDKYDFSAYKMGLTKTDIVLPTVAERRLNASSASDPVGYLISVLSGQRRMLKNAVKIEEREMALDRLNELLDDKFYTDELKLPQEKVKAFKYYAVEDDALRASVKASDAGILKFALAELARKYITVAHEE